MQTTSPDGTNVFYQVGATSDCDPFVELYCFPESGSFFPIGLTTVTCYAEDFTCGLSAQCSFPVQVVQVTNLLRLTIAAAGTGVVLSWPDPLTGFTLQSTPTLASPNWMAVTQAVVVAGSDKTVTVPEAEEASRFYRLFKP